MPVVLLFINCHDFFYLFQDYEVALSLGHLASLYNYDMEQYEKAEQLYLRSIAIGQSMCYSAVESLTVQYV